MVAKCWSVTIDTVLITADVRTTVINLIIYLQDFCLTVASNEEEYHYQSYGKQQINGGFISKLCVSSIPQLAFVLKYLRFSQKCFIHIKNICFSFRWLILLQMLLRLDLLYLDVIMLPWWKVICQYYFQNETKFSLKETLYFSLIYFM